MDTLLLDVATWDLCIDASGNIAVATSPYAVAQDVASACRTFLGEVWYNTLLGVPYKEILGEFPPLSLIKDAYVAASILVPGCTHPVVKFSDFTDRKLTGQIQFVLNGATQIAGF